MSFCCLVPIEAFHCAASSAAVRHPASRSRAHGSRDVATATCMLRHVHSSRPARRVAARVRLSLVVPPIPQLGCRQCSTVPSGSLISRKSRALAEPARTSHPRQPLAYRTLRASGIAPLIAEHATESNAVKKASSGSHRSSKTASRSCLDRARYAPWHNSFGITRLLCPPPPDYQYTPKLKPAMASMIGPDEFDVALAPHIVGKSALKGGPYRT